MFEELFIFEMANNHQGNVQTGISIINAVRNVTRKYHIHAAIKFQFRDPSIIHPDFVDANVPHIPRLVKTRLPKSAYYTMAGVARAYGLTVIATPFDELSVDMCERLGVDIIKVASCSSTDWPLLERIAETGKPVIVSTGGLSIDQVDDIDSFMVHHGVDYALLHCIGEYPAIDTRLDFITRLRERYPDTIVGYSGHEAPDNTDVVKIAVGLGAKILERHIGVVDLNAYSMNPEQADAWVDAALEARRLCKDEGGRDGEAASLRSLMRGVYASKSIKAGAIIKDVFFAMPLQDGQLSSGEYGTYRAVYKASLSYQQGDPIIEIPYEDDASRVRGILHDVKGMLNEAKIVTGDSKVELSHHYGIRNFRKYGATIINVVNRDYCKKYIIMLPGQVHPDHYHERKEETFHVLRGQLYIEVNGNSYDLRAGDLITIERGQVHGFTSDMGAIFEEISTHHDKGGSIYIDKRISNLDPMQRKTEVEL